MRTKKSSNSNSSLSVFNDKYLTKLLSESGNSYASLVEDNEDKFNFFDTGSYTLNLLLTGSVWKGHPDNFITVFAGESATGKSFFIIAMLKEFQKQYPNGMAFVFESENAPTWMKDSLKKIGVDTSRLVKYPVTTVQEVTHQATKLATMYADIPADERPPTMLILDSLGNLSTEKEMNDSEEGKTTKDMTRPPEIKKMFRVLTQKLGKVNMPMLVTNHVYDVIGSYFPQKKQGGGRGPEYMSSSIITLSKSKDKTSDGDIVGSIITAKIAKGRLTKENMEVKTKISYKHGLDRYYGLLELAEEYGLIKLVGKQYEFYDGTKAFKKNILADPEKFWTKDVLDKIDDVIGKQFQYGGGSDSDSIEEVGDNDNE